MRALPLILVMSFVAVGCEGDTDSPTQPSPTTMTVLLAPGGTTNALGLTVQFEQVLTDTRCPADALCPQVGDASIAVNVSLGAVPSRYELFTNDATKRRATYQDYDVELSTLQPYPFGTRPIDPTAYRATLLVTRR